LSGVQGYAENQTELVRWPRRGGGEKGWSGKPRRKRGMRKRRNPLVKQRAKLSLGNCGDMKGNDRPQRQPKKQSFYARGGKRAAKKGDKKAKMIGLHEREKATFSQRYPEQRKKGSTNGKIDEKRTKVQGGGCLKNHKVD